MDDGNDDIYDHLKNLIDGSYWTYTILWRRIFPQPLLKFHRGYYKGTGEDKEDATILESSDSVAETRSEWFFKISMDQSFRINGDDLPGHAFCTQSTVWVTAADYTDREWERVKWGQHFGIRTFICVPLGSLSVLELASIETVPYRPQWINDVAEIINANGNGSHSLSVYSHPDQTLRNGRRLGERANNEMQNRGKEKISDSIRNDKRLRQRTDNEMQNRGKEKISDDSNRNDKRLHERADNEMQNRGKEKISESICSWSLLTESSDTCIGTDTTFSCSHEYSGPS